MPSEREVRNNSSDRREMYPEKTFEEIVFLGLYQYTKWDRCIEKEEDGQTITPTIYSNIADSITRQEIRDIREKASRLISEEFQAVIDEHANNREINHGWLYGFSQSLVAAFVYSIILLVLYIVVLTTGSDLGSVLTGK